ncbi:hypothetical protein J2X31_003327 [Flavobacterium arsenatis]|uniref:Reverse transcriptase domain-containing protein n=1 Tax=Flavobacterium arsenatis TaxID=1484332 RepID=A0ABU1TTU5_9FLAO|nr:antiviral reverse transcriptase Drt3a [Flavobacterium arsenatis]MDR6969297.1 hypothetical protein [Flavobacterium arsenatis]
MLNQSFSFENLKSIHEIQNRKGNYFEEFYSEGYHIVIEQLKEKRKEIKQERLKINFNEDVLNELLKEKQILEDLKENYLEDDLNKFSNKINSKSFDFILKSFKHDPAGKEIYTTSKDAESYFAMKQLQFNVQRTFKVKQSNRYQIVRQLKVLLEDQFPKYIIRTDISQFYESVPQNELCKLLESNSLLSPKSKSLIKNLLYNYNKATNQLGMNTAFGIPRGVGISPFLAELYMRKIDEEIKNIPNVTFYGRYVDDIIIIFTPFSKHINNKYLEMVKKIIADKGLIVKESKTQEINLLNTTNERKDIDFLGYSFNITNSKLNEVKLSVNKKDKYKIRVEKILDRYLKDRGFNKKEAKRLLIHRINYLTKNTKLHQPKKGVIGIYYSNSLLDEDCSCLSELDKMLVRTIDHKLPFMLYSDVNRRLKTFSFIEGFKNKTFYNINSKKKSIPDLRSPKDKEAKPLMNNFERIVEAWK